MKKICFITTVSTTLKAFIMKTAEYLHENTDWDISFICSDDPEFEESLPDYIRYFPVHMERGISVAGIKAMLQIKKIFKKEKFDLIQYSTPNASLYAAIAGKLAGIPVRLYCQWGMAYVGFDGLKRRIFRFEEKMVCSLSTWVEPDSKSNLEFAHSEKLYPKIKGSVIWNGSACGVDLNKFDVRRKSEYRKLIREKYSIPEDAFVYGFVGRITRDKGINELLAAFKHALDKNHDLYLMMVGANENDATVDTGLFDWSKNCNHVIYTGFTSVVEKFLSAMDVYVLPSYREGFGMSVVEAEAMAVPVIVTDIPGPVDAIDNGRSGIAVKMKDIVALQVAMEKLSLNHEIRLQMGNYASEYVRMTFDQQIILQKILQDRKRLMLD